MNRSCRSAEHPYLLKACSGFDEMSDLKFLGELSHLLQKLLPFSHSLPFFSFLFLRLFLCVPNHSVPPGWAHCLLLYCHISAEKLETSISSFQDLPTLEL